MHVNVIDLFAGPGGLGEGFATYRDGKAFQILVSAEMEVSAHTTLTLRSFFRKASAEGDKRALTAYYDFCHGDLTSSPTKSCRTLWAAAREEARQLVLGEPTSNVELDEILARAKLDRDRTVLIGGPPCQAYSLVGRSRNKGKKDYVPEADGRHYLYQEYLRILGATSPAVFVMENVKGILSSKVSGRRVFSEILRDLSNPRRATSLGQRGANYRIFSVKGEAIYSSEMNPDEIDAKQFVVKADQHGIPQARHRVILIGVRTDLDVHQFPGLTPIPVPLTVGDAIGELPRLRSRLSHGDSDATWTATIQGLANEMAAAATTRRPQLVQAIRFAMTQIEEGLPVGSLRMQRTDKSKQSSAYNDWIGDRRLEVHLNHEARSHMAMDLGRYFYATVFANHYERSAKGHEDFNLPGLAPAHINWKSGKFADRFRVQRFQEPSTTVTSHIAKDGHYFIHPDSQQCRSLTVREAARLQSFPDNYFFQGNRTQQYHQVGNAVPPLLAAQLANQVATILRMTQ